MNRKRFTGLAAGTLVLTLLVILWGAFVRASSSGAGCGREWPLCKGGILPNSPTAATLVELAHRTSSGLALCMVAALVFFARRQFPNGHRVRFAAAAALVFFVAEALIGATLVLRELVAYNTSVARAVVLSLHLVNTFLLMGSLSLVVLFSAADFPKNPDTDRFKGVCTVGILLLLVVGVSGALTSLGDTLFPARSFSEGMALDFEQSSHFLLRLRIWHPVIAIGTACYLMLLSGYLALTRSNVRVKVYARLLIGLLLTQVILGMANLFTLGAIALQLAHLFVAHCVWMTNLMMTVSLKYYGERATVAEELKGVSEGLF